MQLNNVVFVKGQGGLGRPLPGQDFISSLVYYCANSILPAGFSTTNRIKQLFQVSDAIAAGINSDFRDETAATGSYAVTSPGGTGTRATSTDTVTLGATNDTVTPFVNGSALCAAVIQTGTETTAALLAAKIAAAITAAVSTNGGFTAAAAAAVITISAPLSSGSNYNTVVPTFTVVGTIAIATTAFAGGVFPSSGDAVSIFVTEYTGKQILLGIYKKPVTDITNAAVATGIAAAINNGTGTGAFNGTGSDANTGYTATAAAAVVTIKARVGLGKSLNTGTPIAATISVGSTVAGTIAQFSGGISSLQAIWYYHISEFFRMQPGGQLYVGFFTTPIGQPTFSEIDTVQDFAQGAIRQFGIYKDFAALSVPADIDAIQTAAAALDTVVQGVSVILGADISGTADISTITSLATLSDPKVSVCIAQDVAGLGGQLFAGYGKSITALGAFLGAVAFAAVNEDIAWVGKFNFSNGFELDTFGFANGQANPPLTSNLPGAINALRYLFLRKIANVSGSYANDSHTAIAVTSDYAYIENNRTIDKAIRGIYASIIPTLNGPLVLNADGTPLDTTISTDIDLCNTPLLTMKKANELSAYEVTIDPTQNVASTSQLFVTVKLVPVGVGREIIINIGFTAAIA